MIQKVKTIKQLFFLSRTKEHLDYFENIERIAEEIGNALKVDPNIVIDQTKEKFGRTVVYMRFIKESLESYKFYRKTYLEFKKKYPNYWKSILSGADYPVLLEANLNKAIEMNPYPRIQQLYLKKVYKS